MPYDGAEFPTVARKMRQAFGPNGEHWCRNTCNNGQGQHCLLGMRAYLLGAGTLQTQDVYQLALAARKAGAPVGESIFRRHDFLARGTVTDWNDAPTTTFADILRALDYLHDMEIAEMAEVCHAV